MIKAAVRIERVTEHLNKTRDGASRSSGEGGATIRVNGKGHVILEFSNGEAPARQIVLTEEAWQEFVELVNRFDKEVVHE